nr:MAG: high-affinity branched-chain amino acid ABC transporter ATP-binding protein LivG [Chloroflexota bacterium]
MTLLQLDAVEKTFGGLRAVRGVSFSVERGRIFGLIGPNGAGKTTVFNVVTGVYRPDGGRVLFKGEDISGKKPAQIAALGIARTFQNIRLFRAMTVEQNVMVAGHKAHQAGLLAAILRTRRHLADERALRQRARELLEMMNLSAHAMDQAGSLPYGSQRRLEIARALMLSPEILLLDEPAAGMNSQEAHELERQIRFLRDELGLTVLLVEHNMSVVMSVCEVIHVVDHGETIAEGPPAEIRRDPRVLAAYLGQDTRGDAAAEP